MAEGIPYIRLENLSFSYDQSVPMFDGFCASFAQESTTLLTGANGAGKTTLLKLLVGLLKPASGSILVSGRESHLTPLNEIAACIAVSPQKAEYQMFLTTIRREIAFGPSNLSRLNAEELVDDAMNMFSLSEFADVHPYDIHASRRKLLSLASAVAMDTPFLIFDEPTAGLSKPEKAVLSSALRTLKKRGKGYLLISHDLSFALSHCERTIVLKEGKSITDRSTAVFLGQVNAGAIMRSASVKIPTSSRLSRLFGHHPVAKSTDEFVSLLKDQIHDH